MNTKLRYLSPIKVSKQAGLSLLELMVSLVISMIVLTGVFSVFISTDRSFRAQTGFARLQDDQRQISTILTQIIQSAGYLATPTQSDPMTAFPVASVYGAGGQIIFGEEGANANTPDTLYVRFQSGNDDGVLNCLGETNTASGVLNYSNAFTVSTADLQLTCSVNGGTPVPIVGAGLGGGVGSCNRIGYLGIRNIKFLYGFDAAGTGSITQYLSASGVQTASGAAGWGKVRSVQANLTMLYCAQQGETPQNIFFSRTIFLPNQL